MDELLEYMDSLTYVKCEWVKELPGISNPKVGTVQDIDKEGALKLQRDGYVKIL